MATKQFKAESKRLLDLMINSIYTHKEIFLRELISNASDAIDKLYFRSLTDDTVQVKKKDLGIRLSLDKAAHTLTVSDNGIGMTKDELEKNLGTIAKSGSLDFKQNTQANSKVDIIGQFGVGFYSAFMVAKRVTVISRAHGESEAWKWESCGGGLHRHPLREGGLRHGRHPCHQGRRGRRALQRISGRLAPCGPCEEIFRLYPLAHPHAAREIAPHRRHG